MTIYLLFTGVIERRFKGSIKGRLMKIRVKIWVKNILALSAVFAIFSSQTNVVAAETKDEVNSIASRTGKVAYWIEICGLVTAAPGAASLLGGTSTAIAGRGVAKFGSVALGPLGIGFLANGAWIAGVASTVEYVANGKLRLFAKADVREATMLAVQAAEETPEAARAKFAPVVLSLNRNKTDVLNAANYASASIHAAQFIQAVDQEARDLKARGIDRISIDETIALAKKSVALAGTPELDREALEAHFAIAQRTLSLNEVYVREFVEYGNQTQAN
jgi:hypothetical protein